MVMYTKEITLPIPSPTRDDQVEYVDVDNIKLETIYNFETHEYVAIVCKIRKNNTHEKHRIFYFKVPYEREYGFANLRKIFENTQLDYDYSTYISNQHNNIDLMNTIINLFETIQNEIQQSQSSFQNNKTDVM